MLKNKYVVLLFSALVLVFAAFIANQIRRVSVPQSPFDTLDFPSTPVIASCANEKFIKDMTVADEMNRGMTIERLPIAEIPGVSQPSVNHISVLVLNHTDEPIVFQDIGFEIRVYGYNLNSCDWTHITLPYLPEKTRKVLPPRLEEFSFDELNTWEISASELEGVDFKYLRLYVSGRGEETQKSYGAHLDLSLQQ